MTDWKHDALQADLAAHLRGYAKPAMVWTNMQLGPVGSPRPDVYTIEPTYTALRAMAYEIKVSRADFLRDAQAGKALGYLNYAGAVVFAAPKGMLSKAEIPAGCGLIERGDEAWRWTKKPTIQPVKTLPFTAWMKLLIDGRERDEGSGLQVRVKAANEWAQQQRARKLLGEELGQLLADRNMARMRLEREIAEAKAETDTLRLVKEDNEKRRRAAAEEEVRQVRAAVCAIAAELGLPEDAHARQVIAELRALTPSGEAARIIDAARTIRSTIRTLEHAANALDPAPTPKVPA